MRHLKAVIAALLLATLFVTTVRAACTPGGIYFSSNLVRFCQADGVTWALLQLDQDFTYHEGSWTPVLTSPAGTKPSFTTASGFYTRNGRSVTYTAYLNNTVGGTKGVGGNQLSMSLPLTPGSSQLPVRLPIGTGINGSNEQIVFGSYTPLVATVVLWRLTGTDLVTLDNVDFNNVDTRQIAITGTFLLGS